MSAAPPCPRDPGAERRGHRLGGRVHLRDRRRRQAAGSGRRARRPAAAAPQTKPRPSPSIADQPLAPQRVGALELPDRQRVEELVGDHDRAAPPAAPRPRRPSDGARPPSVAACRARSAGLVSTSQTARRVAEPGAPRSSPAARRASACRAPARARRGRRAPAAPWSSQTCATQAPTSSPNIWLISGAVTKSPRRAERIAGRVVAVLRMPEAERHVGVEPHRPRRRRSARRISAPSAVTPAAPPARAGSRPPPASAATGAGPWSGPSRRRAASTWPCGLPAVTNWRVGLAEALDEDPRQTVADQEQPEHPPRPRQRAARGSRARGRAKSTRPSSPAS